MPNLRGTSPVGRDGKGRSYAAQTVSRGRPNQRCHGRGGILSTEVMKVYAGGVHRQGRMGALAGAHG